MKKILSLVVVCMILVTMSVSAFAAAPTTTENDGSWTTAGSNADYAEKMMTILAYEGSLSVNSIQYIDQTVADANGNYSFENYIPKDIPTGSKAYTVKIGGEVIGTPVDAGTIVGTGARLSGTVNCLGNATGATITLTPTEGAAEVITTDVDGAFDEVVKKGTYTLVVRKDAHTTYTKTGFEVSDDVDDLSYTIYGGDIDGSGIVALSDIKAVLNNYETTDEASDINESGSVTVEDLLIVLANLTAKNISE
ncbi:MAG: carboxypeptidase regulatory-like domain-containing protein [Ruminococcaceae bacterium]|nr:carboxypeptidase regulatory-like domain-containing protein [Oscillospiraceae bacterium]